MIRNLNLVEVRGIEPRSLDASIPASTRVVCLFILLRQLRQTKFDATSFLKVHPAIESHCETSLCKTSYQPTGTTNKKALLGISQQRLFRQRRPN